MTQDESTSPTIEERVSALESWRTGTVAPGLAAARVALREQGQRLDVIEEFRQRVQTAWRALAQGKRTSIEGMGAVEAPRDLTGEERAALAWLVEQRRRAAR